MLLRSVQLHNFGRYKDTSTVDMRITDERNIVLINGDNDRGKTTLLKAIKFALFGDQQKKLDSLINYQQARLGDGSMHVEIVFEHNDREYRLRRSVKFRRVNEDEMPTVENPVLSILENGRDTDLEQEWLEHLLPNDVSQFFIFDGEQIQSYINKAATSLKEPIEVILGIKELLNARADIKDIENDLIVERQDAIAAQMRKQERLKTLRKNLSKHKDTQRWLVSSITQANRDVIKFTNDLDSHKQLKDLNEKDKTITNNIEELERNKKNLTDKVAEQRSNFGVFLLRPLLQLVDGHKPSVVEAWESTAAHSVLEKDLCVCGRPLDAESVKVLKAKMAERTRPQHRLYEIVSKILARHDLDTRMNDLDDALQKLQQNHDRMDYLNDKRYDIKKEIDGNTMGNGFDYDYTVKNLREAQGNVGKWKRELGECEEKIVRAKEKLKNFEKEIELYTGSTRLTNIDRRLAVAEELSKAIKLAIDDFYKKRKPKLEKAISDVFIRLTNNPHLYRRLEVKDDFSIRIVRGDGMSLPTTRYSPSAGASQIVATAIISGLSNFAMRDAPIIIDTPLGRLDPIHKINVIKHYSQMGRQVIVLYQQSEMNDQNIQLINSSIASEWRIRSIPDQPGVSAVSLVRSNL